MQRIKKLSACAAIMLLLTLSAVGYSSVGQVNQFAKDGLSFSYPSDWPLQDQSDAQMQSLSLSRGQNEAQIIIAALRRELTPEQLAEIQPAITQAIVDHLAQAIEQAGAPVQRSSVSAMIGGTQASGVRLRAVVKGEAGNADIYWLVIGGRLIHVVYVGSDQELARATTAWNMVCSTLRIGTVAPMPTPSRPATAPGDLNSFSYRRVTGNRVELYMDEWGRGYVHDLNNNAWVRIPDYSGRSSHAQSITIQIHPSFCKTSDTMALMYAFGGLLVYDSSLYSAQNPNQAWVLDYEVSQRGQAFASISRTKVINHIAQVNDQLALAAGTNWICVYDRSLHKWVNYQAPVDDSTYDLDRNLSLAANSARVRVLNGPFCNYALGSATWRCQ